jgi:hypothetical protein
MPYVLVARSNLVMFPPGYRLVMKRIFAGSVLVTQLQTV